MFCDACVRLRRSAAIANKVQAPNSPPPPPLLAALVGGAGGGIATGQALPVGAAVAVEVALVGVTTTSAKSCAPWSSVTVRRSVKLPDAGAWTVAVA